MLMNTLSAGSIVSHYRIKELIARGGMGEVYKAVDTSLGRTVAIKIPANTIAADEKSRRRFMREAHAASRLSHPNICTIFEVGEMDGRPFIVMEFIDGPTIQQMLQRSPLSIEASLRLSLQIADALEESHRGGIIHRDLKPSNIIINPRGMAMILDFGLAKRLRDSESVDEESQTMMQSLTTEATIIGTVAYMSPEQVRARPLDARSDVFSFGVLLYEMLTGERPFTGSGQVEIMHAILHGKPTAPHQLRAEVDRPLSDLVMRAMRKEVSERYQTVAELKQDLWQLIKDRGFDFSAAITTAATARSHVEFLTKRLTKPWVNRVLTSKKVIWAAVTAAILLFVIWFWRPVRTVIDPNLLSGLKTVQLLSWKTDLGDIIASWGKFSSNGRYVVYSKTQAGNTDLWIKQVNGGEVPVVGTQDSAIDRFPIFSPDDEQIAFISNRGGSQGIWRIPRNGGNPELLTALASGSSELVSWSRNGEKIYFDQNSNLYQLELASGRQKQLTRLPEQAVIGRGFSLSRQEDRVAYADVVGGQRDIWVQPLTGGLPAHATDDTAADANPIWHPDGKRIVYNSTRGGIEQICLLFLGGQSPVQLTLLDVDCDLTDVSLDGTRILYSVSKDEADVWERRLEGDGSQALTSDVGVELWPNISPDGRSVVYQASASSAIELANIEFSLLVKTITEGSRAVVISPSGFLPQWSRDGQTVAFLRSEEKQNSLWAVRVDGGNPRRLSSTGVLFGGFTRLPYNRLQTTDFSWSPDGSKLAFSDARNIHIVDVDGSAEVRETENNDTSLMMFNPIFSPDGAQIAFLSRTRNPADGRVKSGVWVSEQGKMRQLHESAQGLRLVGWINSGSNLLVKAFEGKGEAVSIPVDVDLYQIPVRTGAPRLLAKLARVYVHNIQLSQDGRTVAYVARLDRLDQLEVINIPAGSSRALQRSDDPRTYFAGLSWSPDGKNIYYSKHTNTRSISMIDHLK